MFTFAYPAVFKRDADRRLLVSFPDFPIAHTDGVNAREAMEEAIDCLGSSIASPWLIRRTCRSRRA